MKDRLETNYGLLFTKVLIKDKNQQIRDLSFLLDTGAARTNSVIEPRMIWVLELKIE